MTSAVLALLLVAPVVAGPREDFKAAVAAFQKAPYENALREKMLKLAAKLKPTPTIPPEAKRAFVMAGTYQKEAKSPSDFMMAVNAYDDALKAAPWWGDAYYNQSVALEAAGRLNDAKEALGFYLLTKPKDAEEAQNRLYALDAKGNLAAKQAREAAAAVAAEKAKPDFSGRWGNDHSNRYEFTMEGGGAVSVRIYLWNDTSFTGRARVDGRALTGTWDRTVTSAGTMCPTTYSGTLSEDNQRLEWSRTSHCGGDPMQFSLVLTREK